MLCRVLVIFAAGFACAVARADGPELKTPEDVAAAIKEALRKNNDQLLGAAITRAKELKETTKTEDLLPIVAALEPALKSDSSTRQWVALDLIEHLEVPGSYRYFRSLLDIPDRLIGTGRRNARDRAIRMAATLGGEEALEDLRKLLLHPDVRFARSAVRALGTYAELEPKAKGKLARVLVAILAREERQVKHRDDAVAKRAQSLCEEIPKALTALTGKEDPKTAEEWKAALKEDS